jgi:L-ascorbate metabolism protein UlaG (beta-lactamase superfamily)
MHQKRVNTFAPAKKKGRKFQNPVETRMATFSMLPKILWLYLKNRDERFPKSALGPFRTDATLYERPPASGLRVTWLGHSSMLIEIDSVRILVDPMWDKRASPLRWSGPKRFFPPPIKFADLPPIDIVLISHDHFDHLGKDTITGLARLEALRETRWVTSLGVGEELRRFGVREDSITELDWTHSATIETANTAAELTITALPARHFSGRSLLNRFETLWSSFVIRGARHKIYFGADSGLWDGFSEIGSEYGPFDVTMLEVGAYNELWKAIHLGPDGAAQAFASMGASGLLMPIHWGLFELAPQGWREPIEKITELADQLGFKLWSPEPGAPTEVIAGKEVRSSWWRTSKLS